MKTTDLHNQISVGVGIALTAVADGADVVGSIIDIQLSLIQKSEPTRHTGGSRFPSSVF